LSAAIQRRTSGAITSAAPQTRTLNAETVTVIATGFLKRIGNKGGLKPKRVSLEEGIYTVEVEMKKLTAIVVSAAAYVALYFAFKMLGL
jgi:hypothetical protein